MTSKKDMSNESFEDINFLKSFALERIASDLSIVEEEQIANSLVREVLRSSHQHQLSDDYKLPDHLEKFRREFESVEKKRTVAKIPEIRQLSPRTRKAISLIPPPTKNEEKQIKSIEDWVNGLNTNTIYQSLSSQNPLRDDEDIVHNRGGSGISKTKNSTMSIDDKPVIDNKSASYYTTTIQSKKYEKEKAEKLERLFNKYNDDDVSFNSFNDRRRNINGARKPKTLPKLIMNGSSSTLSEYLENKRESSPPINIKHSAIRSTKSREFQMDEKLHSDAIKQLASNKKSISYRSVYGSLSVVPQKKMKHQEVDQIDDLNTVLIAASSIVGTTFEDQKSSRMLPPKEERFPSSTDVIHEQTIDFQLIQKEYEPVLKDTENFLLDAQNRYLKEYCRLELVTSKLEGKSEQEYLNLFSVKVLEESGLDLNKEYNKVRNFKIYLMKMSYHFYIQRLKNGFEQLALQSKRLKAMMLANAARTIVRTFKLYVHLKHEALRKKYLLDQQVREAIRLERLNNIAHYSSLSITKAIYRYTKLKRFRREWFKRKSCTKIQKLIRGFIGRKRALSLKVLKRFLSNKITVIQCAYRCRLARRKVLLYKKLAFVRNWMNEINCRKDRIREHIKQDGAELYIVKAYRTLMIRRKLKRLIYWHRYQIAIVIQRIYRGYRVRKRFYPRLKKHRLQQKFELKSIIIIQTAVRRYLAKKKVWKILTEKKRKAQQRRQTKMLETATRSSNNSLSWIIRRAYRKIQLFRYAVLNKKAIIIQRIWRGHHGRYRFFMVHCMFVLKDFEMKYQRKTKAITSIQKRWRGYICRISLIRKYINKYVIRIQSLFRIVKARRRVKLLKERRKNSQRLLKFLFRMIKRFKFRRTWRRRKALQQYAIRIQTYYRKIKASRKVNLIVYQRRTLEEVELSLRIRLNNILTQAQVALVQETLVLSMGQKFNSISKQDCICNGPLQAIFTFAAVNKGRTESSALISNKTDSTTVLKFLKSISGLMEKTDGGSHQDQLLKKKAGTATNKLNKSNTYELSLLTNYDENLLCLPDLKRKVRSNEIDILFSKARKDVTSGNYLSYSEFLNFLQYVAELHFKGNNESKKPISRPSSPNEVPSLSHANKNKTNETIKQSIPSNLSSKQVKFNFMDCFSNSNTNEPNYRLALVLKIISSLRKEAWMKQILDWINIESRARLNLFAIRIQCLARKYLGKWKFAEAAIQHLKYLKDKNVMNAAIKIQSIVLMFIYRYRVARLAQRTIIQYNPHLAEPYWFHPHTKVKSFKKPKVLRSLNSYSIALPEEGLENVINCFYCNKKAEVNCNNCEDSMCRVCYDSMHCKGQRKGHESFKIPNCSYCKFQAATKSCLTCLLNPPPLGHIKESVSEIVRGLYCDTCFSYEHDKSHKSLQYRRNGIKNLLTFTKQAYLVRQHIHHKFTTDHFAEDLVQPCEECQSRSGSWRCIDCNQIYCNSCLVGLHSMGGVFGRHRAEQLSYYTPKMHISFKKDINRQLEQTKLIKLNRNESIRREQLHRSSVIRIQAWWRKIYIGFAGRKEMKRRRRRMRIHYKAYKKDTKEYRNTFLYKCLDTLGYAPHLASDSREDTVIKSRNIFQKQTAREFIWKNQDEWGFYRTSRTDPRKGIPISGFNVGTIEELLEQAEYGGYRLPGCVFVVPGEKKFVTSYDLSNILRPGEIVRIRTRLFGIVKVKDLCIHVNRFWRAGTEDCKGDEDGELMFRIPIYNNEPERLKFRMKYLGYSLCYENPISQAYFQLYKSYAQRMIRFSLYMVRMNRRNGLKEESEAWRSTSVKYADAVRYATSFMKTGEEIVDLSGTENNIDESLDAYGNVKGKTKKRKSFMGDNSDEMLDNGYDQSDSGSSLDDAEQLKMNKLKPTPSSTPNSSRRGSKTYIAVAVNEIDNLNNNNRPSSATQKASVSKVNSAEDDALDELRKIKEERSKRRAERQKSIIVKADKPWYANAEQTAERKQREDKMSLDDLAKEADQWKECVDPMTENIYYQNMKSNELMSTIPRSVAAKRQLEFQNSKNKKNYDDAQKRISKLERVISNRKLITGGNKK